MIGLTINRTRLTVSTVVLVNNYFGRQFNSLNDIAINPRNKDVYFTDPIYGLLQDFRPKEGLPHQVYRYNDRTGALTVVADGLSQPNGLFPTKQARQYEVLIRVYRHRLLPRWFTCIHC
jgi:gluconolactonase